MSHDHRRRILLQREFHDLAGMHARAVYRAAEQLLELNEAMTFVEVQAAKHFVLEIAQACDQEVARRLRAR